MCIRLPGPSLAKACCASTPSEAVGRGACAAGPKAALLEKARAGVLLVLGAMGVGTMRLLGGACAIAYDPTWVLILRTMHLGGYH